MIAELPKDLPILIPSGRESLDEIFDEIIELTAEASFELFHRALPTPNATRVSAFQSSI